MRSATASISLRMSNVDFPAYGVSGGMNGRSGQFIVNPGRSDQRILPSLQDGVVLRTGDVLRIAMPGGGGFGHPFDREPQRVLADVLGGFVSAQSARDEYGVIIDVAAETVDLAATEAHRSAHRWQTKLLHRRDYFDPDQWWDFADAATHNLHARY
jgi:N-methylhydantoinase B